MYAALTILLSRHVLPMLVAAAALGAFAIGYLAGFSAVFDFSAQFTAHWLMIAVFATVACFFGRRAYTLLACGLVAAVVAPTALTAWYAAGSVDRAAGPIAFAPAAEAAAGVKTNDRRRFTVLSFNTYNHNTDLAALAAEIQRHHADVVILIEFGPNKAALKARLLNDYPHHRSCDDNWDCAIGIFSRLPVAGFQVVAPHDDAGPSMISAEIVVDEQAITIIGAHVLSPNHGPRANFIELDHLAGKARVRRLPMVVAGDLNTTIWANAFDNFRRKSGLTHMGALIPTWPTLPVHLPQLGIDHVFTSPELRLVSIASGNPAGSDHTPLLATIELR